MELQTFVELRAAREARGLRLIVTGALPSPWGEAAKALFRVKGLPALIARWNRQVADEVKDWTGARNVPIVVHDDEPARTGWAEILALAERLGGPRLVPSEPAGRARVHGLIHELAGEGGMGWCGRLIMIDGGLTSGGARGFPLRVAEYLAPRYGYLPERVEPARQHLIQLLGFFDQLLAGTRAAGHRYLLGPELSALDLYLATFLTPMVGVSEAECPQMAATLRPAFTYLQDQLGAHVPHSLADHRAFVFAHHLPGPISL